MKKLLFLLLISSRAYAQPTAYFAAGADTHKTINYNFGFGYDIGRLELNGEVIASLTRKTTADNYFGINAGYAIANELYIEAGYYYDKTLLSAWHYSAGIKYIKMVNDIGGLTGRVFYINNSGMASIGIIYIIK